MRTLLLLLLIGLHLGAPIVKSEDLSFNRVRHFDAIHYKIGLRFDKKRNRVFGDSELTLRPLSKPLSYVELDARDIDFNSITDHDTGKQLEYEYNGRKLRIKLNETLRQFQSITLRFVYSARPRQGIYFIPPSVDGDKVLRSAQIWTQGEAEETHHWLPSYDFPDDKATTEQIIKVESEDDVIGNGKLLSNTLDEDGTRTFHYKMDVPHSIYLSSFVVGRFLKIEDRYRDIPLGYYIYPGGGEIAAKAFGKTKDMMRVFEDLTGVKYPFNKYDQTVVAGFPFGGMENITATTYADTEINMAGNGGAEIVQDLVSHELAHSWFGNLVTCRNWAELWTNESFASFMEAAYRERTNGRKDYLRKIRADTSEYLAYNAATEVARHGLFNTSADPEDDLTMFDPVTYNKGSAVVHTLREEIGDTAFWKGINLHLTTYRFDNVETKDVRETFEKASGRSLGWFFDQWVYRSGHPKISVRQRFDRRTGILTLTFKQKAVNSQVGNVLYHLPLDIFVETSQKQYRQTLLLSKKSQQLAIKTRIRPQLVEIDRDLKIPVKDLSIAPLEIK